MRFIISSNLLLKNLQKISGVMSTSNTLPILEDFLFELSENNQLKITASDLETTMTVDVQVEMAENPGKVAIPAKILLEILKTFPDIPVTLSVDLKSQEVEMLAGEGKYKLIGHNSDEFPQVPEMEETESLTLNGSLLVNAFNKTLFATGNDEMRPVMSGVYCEMKSDHINFVATDAHKLVRYRRYDIKPGKESSFILPKKPLSHLKNIMADDADLEVLLEYNPKNVVLSFDNIKLTARLIDGKYPNYEAVIPTQNPYKMVVNRKNLLNSLRRVSIFGSKSTHQVRFKISGQELVLTAEDIDYSSEAKERLSCNYEGENIEIGFNSKFMLEILNTLESENVDLELSAPNRAGIIIPDSNTDDAEDILMLIMPVMLSN